MQSAMQMLVISCKPSENFMERVQGIPWYGKSVALITDLNFNKVPNTAGQGFRIITTAILYRGNLLVCCTGVAYGEAAFSLLLRYPKNQPV